MWTNINEYLTPFALYVGNIMVSRDIVNALL